MLASPSVEILLGYYYNREVSVNEVVLVPNNFPKRGDDCSIEPIHLAKII